MTRPLSSCCTVGVTALIRVMSCLESSAAMSSIVVVGDGAPGRQWRCARRHHGRGEGEQWRDGRYAPRAAAPGPTSYIGV